MSKPKLIKPKLAKKPSELIMQALDDLKFVEKNSKYEIDMSTYHLKDDNEKCAVCFAGATIARAGNDINQSIEPCDFDETTQNKLYALDYFRQGSIAQGIESMGYAVPVILRSKNHDSWGDDDYADVRVTEYEDDAAQFKKEMKDIAKSLAALGL